MQGASCLIRSTYLELVVAVRLFNDASSPDCQEISNNNVTVYFPTSVFLHTHVSHVSFHLLISYPIHSVIILQASARSLSPTSAQRTIFTIKKLML
jgi:hypothetical protein